LNDTDSGHECDVRPTVLDPTTGEFVDSAAVTGGAFHLLSPTAARASFAALQSAQTGKPDVRVRDVLLPVGPRGSIKVRIVCPTTSEAPLPTVMFFHGGGWILGDANTHDRLVREIASSVHASVVVVEFERSPESQFPDPPEEAYAATRYVAEHSELLNVDGSRLAVVGDSTGGNMAAAVTLLAKDRRGPKIAFQVLFYPVLGADFRTCSYETFRSGPWLTRQTMEWFWAAYLPDGARRNLVLATPVNAQVEELKGLPDALLITAESDMTRDEGEEYARKLSEADVRVTCTRYLGTIHDFVTLNALADTPAARGAIAQATAALRTALE
jgi:acetyl esterase